MKARWLTGLAIAAAITILGAEQARAQIARPNAGAAAPGANIRTPQGFGAIAPSPFIPDIRVPQSGGLNPFMGGMNVPNIRNPLSGAFNPFAVNPFFPDIRSPLTGTFNPAANVPFGTFGTFGVPTSVVPPTGLFFGSPYGAPVYVYPNGWDPYGYAGTTPVAVPVPVPVPVPVDARTAYTRTKPRPTVMREGRSIQDIERLMARVPLTNGTITAVGRDAIRARTAVNGRTQVRRYPMAQVFFFTREGELRSAARATRRPTRGQNVLVPVIPVERVVMNRKPTAPRLSAPNSRRPTPRRFAQRCAGWRRPGATSRRRCAGGAAPWSAGSTAPG